MRKPLVVAVGVLAVALSALLAQAAPFVLGSASVASPGASPFAPGCGGPGTDRPEVRG